MIKIRSALLMALALLSTIVVALPTRAASPSAIPLAGITVLEGSRAGEVLVRLPKPLDFSQIERKTVDRQPPVMIFGNGRMVGFVLAQQGATGAERAVYAGWRAGRCLERACTQYRRGVAFEFNVTNRHVLPAGLYKLYLIADGTSARVRLELPGLSGRRVVRARPSDSVSVENLQPTITDTGEGTVFTGAASTDMSGDGFPIHMMWAEGDGEAVKGSSEQCAYAEPQAVYVPGCVGSEFSTGQNPLVARSNYSTIWNEDLTLWRGLSGSYVISGGKVKTVGMVAAWVQF